MIWYLEICTADNDYSSICRRLRLMKSIKKSFTLKDLDKGFWVTILDLANLKEKNVQDKILLLCVLVFILYTGKNL